MSIDAKIIDVCKMEDGTAILHLYQPDNKRCAGQPYLTVLNPEVGLPTIGTEIWGGSSDIMVGEKTIAKRIGYTRIEMIENWEK
jgi:hypothetical protein